LYFIPLRLEREKRCIVKTIRNVPVFLQIFFVEKRIKFVNILTITFKKTKIFETLCEVCFGTVLELERK